MGSKQCPASDAKFVTASLALETQCAAGTAELIRLNPAAFRANRGAVRIGPAHLAERRLRIGIRHTEDGREAEGLGFGGKEEVLGHLVSPVFYRCYI